MTNVISAATVACPGLNDSALDCLLERFPL